MKRLLILKVLLCIMLLSVQARKSIVTWQEIDTLIARGHYTTAYEKGEQLFEDAQRKGDGHGVLHAAYLLHKAEIHYQEDVLSRALARYKEILPKLDGADRAVDYMLIANIYKGYYERNHNRRYPLHIGGSIAVGTAGTDYTQWGEQTFIDTISYYYASALQERDMLLQYPVEEYGMLLQGDEEGRRLRPTLYDVIVQSIIATPASVEADEESAALLANDTLYGDDALFVQMRLPRSEQPYIRQLHLLQSLTETHLDGDVPLRASLDLLRLEYVKHASLLYNPDLYASSLESFIEEYRKSPIWCAEFLYRLAVCHVPNTWNERDAEDKAKAIAYCQEAMRIAPESNGGKQCRELYEDIVRPCIGLAVNEIVLPNENGVVKVSYKNTPDLFFRIVHGSIDESRYGVKLDELVGRKVVCTWSLRPDTPNAYTQYEVLANLPSLSPGTYWLLASNDANFSDEECLSYVRFDCTGLMLHMARDISRREVSGVVVDAKEGTPVRGCEVVLMKRTRDTYTLVGHFRSDDKGGFVIPMAEHSGNLLVKVTDGTSTTYREWSANPYERDTDLVELRCEMHTDRYTYRPGDSIQWNIVACKVGYHKQYVLPDKEVTVVLKDKDYKTVSTVTGATDEYGCLNGSFALPADAVPGRFHFEISMGEKMPHSFHHQVNVESFKAPTFNITLLPLKEILHLGDSVVLQGEVTTYTGLPVNEASIRYRVMRTQQGRYGSTQGVVGIGHITADEKGGFSIPFVAQYVGKTDKQTVCYYTVTMDVTDGSGETHSKTTTVRIGVRTATLSADVPSIMQPGDKLTYSMRNLNGQNVTAEVLLRIVKLNVPQTSRINSNLIGRYPEARPLAGDEDFLNDHPTIGLNTMFDKSTWHEEKVCTEKMLMTSDQGESAFIPELTEDGIYKVEFIYHDGDSEVKETAYFTRLHKGSLRIPGLELLMSYAPEQTIVAGGSAPLYIGTHYENVHVYYIVQQGYRIIDRGELTLNDQLVPITIHAPEEDSDQIVVYAVTVKEGVVDLFVSTFNVVPQSDKLNIAVSTFRNYLEPGETELCTLTIKDHAGNAMQAAATVAVIDAALDVYGTSDWNIPTRGTRYMWQYLSDFTNHTTSMMHSPYRERYTLTMPQYYRLPYLDMWHYRVKARNDVVVVEEEAELAMASGGLMRLGSTATEGFVMSQSSALTVDDSTDEASSKSSQGSQDTSTSYLRKDFRHTALFLPNMHTDGQGRVVFAVTAPDLLTKWHVKGIAHTKDLKYGRVNFDFITRKTLMVQPNVPRFLYEGDQCDFTAKVSNSGDETIVAVVRLEIDNEEYSRTVSVEANGSTAVSFPIIAPAGKDCLTYRITVESQRYSDGEQAAIPLLPRRTLVTETMALYVNGKEKREFVFEAMASNRSKTLEHKSLTLDIVANPIWYAIEAMPSLCTVENPTNECLFHRYYAAMMGLWLIDRYPEMENYNAFYRHDSLTVLSVKLLNQLAASQGSDGGWSWTSGFDSDRYTTLLIIKGLGELEAMGALGIAGNDTLYTMVKRGIGFLDAACYDRFARMKNKPDTLDSYALYYLYVRSMFPEISFGATPVTAYNHYKQLLLDDRATRGTLMQKAVKMLVLIRLAEHDKASAIAGVVCQSALSSDEMGIYWRDNLYYGWAWDSNPIATQAMLIEAFVQLNQPSEFIGRMQQWLLKQKQTTQWSSSIATAQAVHALVSSSVLPRREEALSLVESVKVKVGNAALALLEENKHGATRYEVIPQKDKQTSAMPAIPLLLEELGEASVAWGSMTWQYYEDVDKVKASGTGLALSATYYKVMPADGMERLVPIDEDIPLEKGDRIRVRLHFTVDRAMDYVELHLQRPAALEPVSTRSGYTYSNGLGCYRSIENTQTVFYLYRLNKGSYFIDCDLWVGQSGNYSCGVSTIQCMYAPEFVATAESMRLSIR